ncbi:MAG: hypothetical protein WCX73_00115 [Candidatus Pacearchaeota archaeon]
MVCKNFYEGCKYYSPLSNTCENNSNAEGYCGKYESFGIFRDIQNFFEGIVENIFGLESLFEE